MKISQFIVNSALILDGVFHVARDESLPSSSSYSYRQTFDPCPVRPGSSQSTTTDMTQRHDCTWFIAVDYWFKIKANGKWDIAFHIIPHISPVTRIRSHIGMFSQSCIWNDWVRMLLFKCYRDVYLQLVCLFAGLWAIKTVTWEFQTDTCGSRAIIMATALTATPLDR